jgi:hypothetical protein
MVKSSYQTFASSILYSNTVIFVLVSIVVVLLVIDTSLVRTSVLVTSESGSDIRINSFIVIISLTVVIEFVVLGFVRNHTMEIRRKKNHIDTLRRITTLSQVAIVAMVILIALQIIFGSQYFIILIVMVLTISSLLGIAMLSLLAQRFFSWLKSERNPLILIFGLASIVVASNIASSLLFVNLVLSTSQVQSQIVPHLGENIPYLIPNSSLAYLDTITNLLSIASFMIMWLAACILFRQYSKKLGTVRYWILVSIPLIYFLSQYITLSLNLFSPLLSSPESIFYGITLTLIFRISISAGGILFGIAFWSVVRNLEKRNIVRIYMVISAYGLVLLFTSNQANVLVTASYPPFGIACASMIGLSSYFVMIGIYSSATSLAHDAKLRQTIRTYAVTESKLLDRIGMADMEQNIQNKVLKMTKETRKSMLSETGINPSLSDQEIKKYLSEVLEEVHKTGRNDKKD